MASSKDDAWEGRPRMSPLNSTNYRAWRNRMRAVLKCGELWDIVEAPHPPTATGSVDVKYRRRELEVIKLLMLNVSDAQQVHIENLDNAYDMWMALERVHVPCTFGAQLELRNRINHHKYTGGDMQEHINSLLDLVSQLRCTGCDLQRQEVCAAITSSLPATYSSFVMGLEALDKDSLSIEYITSKLVAIYRGDQLRHKDSTCKEEPTTPPKTTSVALKVRASEKTKSSRRVICWRCGQGGHMQADCHAILSDKEEEEESSDNRKKPSSRRDRKQQAMGCESPSKSAQQAASRKGQNSFNNFAF